MIVRRRALVTFQGSVTSPTIGQLGRARTAVGFNVRAAVRGDPVKMAAAFNDPAAEAIGPLAPGKMAVEFNDLAAETIGPDVQARMGAESSVPVVVTTVLADRAAAVMIALAGPEAVATI